MRRVMVLALVALLVGCGPATLAGAAREGPGREDLVLRDHRPPAVDLSDAMFAATMAWLTEDLRAPEEAEEGGRLVRAAFEPGAKGGLELLHSQELRSGYDP